MTLTPAPAIYRRWPVVALSLLTLTLAGPSQAASSKAVTIRIVNFEFTPAIVTVAPGAIVTWINGDEDAHSVVSDTKAFHSPALDTNDRYSFTIAAAGDYAYHCGLHPHMVGKILVRR